MYNEIKLLVEQIFTTEQYILNMKYRTPDIVDYFIRKALNTDIGKSTNSMITKINNKYIIINLNSIKDENLNTKMIALRRFIYKGTKAVVISVPTALRDDDNNSKWICSSLFKIITCIFKELDMCDNNEELFASIVTMDILVDIYNEKDFIKKYFLKHIKDETLLDRIFNYIIETDNASYKLLDEFEIIKLVDDIRTVL